MVPSAAATKAPPSKSGAGGAKLGRDEALGHVAGKMREYLYRKDIIPTWWTPGKEPPPGNRTDAAELMKTVMKNMAGSFTPYIGIGGIFQYLLEDMEKLERRVTPGFGEYDFAKQQMRWFDSLPAAEKEKLRTEWVSDLPELERARVSGRDFYASSVLYKLGLVNKALAQFERNMEGKPFFETDAGKHVPEIAEALKAFESALELVLEKTKKPEFEKKD